MKTVTLTCRNGRWHFGTPSILRLGAISYTLRGWHSEYSARRAARREYGRKVKFRYAT